jgi:hypothetical protein
MGTYTTLSSFAARSRSTSAARSVRAERSGNGATGAYFCPACYDSSLIATRCGCGQEMLPRGRTLMVPRDDHSPSRLGAFARMVAGAALAAVVLTYPFLLVGVRHSRFVVPHVSIGHDGLTLLAGGAVAMLAAVTGLIAWARHDRRGAQRASKHARDWLARQPRVCVRDLTDGRRERVAGRLRVEGGDAFLEDDTGRVRVRVGAGTRAYSESGDLAAVRDGDDVELLGLVAAELEDGTYRRPREAHAIEPVVLVRARRSSSA